MYAYDLLLILYNVMEFVVYHMIILDIYLLSYEEGAPGNKQINSILLILWEAFKLISGLLLRIFKLFFIGYLKHGRTKGGRESMRALPSSFGF